MIAVQEFRQNFCVFWTNTFCDLILEVRYHMQDLPIDPHPVTKRKVLLESIVFVPCRKQELAQLSSD
jgi:hypothetical protein